MSHLILGIDPGFTGALALLDPTTNVPTLVGVWDMPLVAHESGDLSRRQIDCAALSLLIDSHANDIRFAVMEDVGAMVYTDKFGDRRGQGASASFAFGKTAGIMLGVLNANYIKTHLIRPSVWKMLMGLNSSKETSRQRATALFPESRERWSRKKDDGRAEAALIAWFGAQRFAKDKVEF